MLRCASLNKAVLSVSTKEITYVPVRWKPFRKCLPVIRTHMWNLEEHAFLTPHNQGTPREKPSSPTYPVFRRRLRLSSSRHAPSGWFPPAQGRPCKGGRWGLVHRKYTLYQVYTNVKRKSVCTEGGFSPRTWAIKKVMCRRKRVMLVLLVWYTWCTAAVSSQRKTCTAAVCPVSRYVP